MRSFVAFAVVAVLTLSGCSRALPAGTAATSTPSAAPAVIVGAVTDDLTSQVLAELYTQGLAAKGRTARIVEIDADATALVARLEADEVDVAPLFARTAAEALAVDNDDPAELVNDLAAALDGEAAVLQPSRIDRAWRYLTEGGAGSLSDLDSGDTVVGSARWRAAPDGPSGLSVVYRARPQISTVDSAAERLARAKQGAVGAFDPTEPEATDPSLVALADPESMVMADPQVALLRLPLAEDVDVLDVLQQLHTGLDNAAVVGIRQRSAGVGVPAAVREWLAAHPIT